MLVGALTFSANLVRLVDTPRQHGSTSTSRSGRGATPIAPEVLGDLDASADVAQVTTMGIAFASVADSPVAFDAVGIQPVRGGLLPDTLEGRIPAGDDEIALGTIEARRLHVAVGQHVTLSGVDGDRRFRVTGITVAPGVLGADGVGNDATVTAGALSVVLANVVATILIRRARPLRPSTLLTRD